MIARIKKNDTVVVLAGKDKGRQGSVIEILPKKGKIMVKGVRILTKHLKARKQGEVGGVKKQEGYLEISQVMPVCPSCKKPCRIGTKMVDAKSVRVCHRCKEIV